SERRAWTGGKADCSALTLIETPDGVEVASHPGVLRIVQRSGEPVEIPIPAGARLYVQDGQKVGPGDLLCSWDPRYEPILAQRAGRVRYVDLRGVTLKEVESDSGEIVERMVG